MRPPSASGQHAAHASTRAVCFGSLAQRSVVSRETINRFLDVMPEGDGQCKIFDINLRQGFYTKEILCNSMRKCNILKINDEELVTVSRMFGYPGIDLQDKCWILLAKYNLKMLILTCGVNGSYVAISAQHSIYIRIVEILTAVRTARISESKMPITSARYTVI